MQIKHFKLISAVHIFLEQQGKVLLLRRSNTGYEDGNYSVVAGHLNGNEEIKTAAIREAIEEVGIKINPSDIEIVGVMHRRSDDERIDWFLASSTWTGTLINNEPNKCDKLAWHSLDALPENLIPYVHRALLNYRKGKWFDSYGWD